MKIIAPPSIEGQTAVAYFVLAQLQRVTAESFLDVGAGDGKYLHTLKSQLPGVETFAVEGYEPAFDKIDCDGKWCGTLPDVLKDIHSKSVDVVYCLDVIEHLTKEGGHVLVREMERIAKSSVVIFTPSGYQPQDGKHLGEGWAPWMEHKCGWEYPEFEALGYETFIWSNFDYGRHVFHDGLWAVKKF